MGCMNHFRAVVPKLIWDPSSCASSLGITISVPLTPHSPSFVNKNGHSMCLFVEVLRRVCFRSNPVYSAEQLDLCNQKKVPS